MNSLRECLYNTIHRNKKPLKVIAEELGMSENYLTRSALPDAEDSDTGTGCRFPLKKLIPLIKATGDFSALDFIEESLGRICFGTPAPKHIVDILHSTMSAIKSFGKLIGDVQVSIADNVITDKEGEKVVHEALATVQAILALSKSVRLMTDKK